MTTEAQGSADAGNPAPVVTETPWYGQDADIKGFVELKGWDSPSKAIESYRHLETFVGADKAGRGVVWPKDDKDTAGWETIYSKLGRPASPDEYKFNLPEGQDAFAKHMAPILHQAGLSQAQAAKLSEAFTAYTAEQVQAAQGAFAEKSEAALNALKSEWGAAYDQKVEMGRTAVNAIGWDAQRLEMIESAIGTAELMKAMAQIGELLGEDRFVSGGKSDQKMTPDAAKAQLEMLQQDKAWLDRLAAGDTEALREKNKLDHAVLGLVA